MRPGVHVNDGLGGGEIQTEPDRWAAENSRHGIFAVKGPDVGVTGEIGPTEITDIAPTLLAAFGVDVPTDMVGSVLPIFEDEPAVGEQDPLTVAAGDDQQYGEVADRLKQLGYME
jgi:hypothetical protein